MAPQPSGGVLLSLTLMFLAETVRDCAVDFDGQPPGPYFVYLVGSQQPPWLRCVDLTVAAPPAVAAAWMGRPAGSNRPL